MSNIPDTRISILTAISKNADSTRWSEFVRAYEAPMRGFLHSRFPSLEADDVIQETLVALVKALPNYHYTPDDKGHFRNYLMGILNHKACDTIRRRTKESEKRDAFGKSFRGASTASVDEAEEQAFRESLFNAALDQLLTDDSINPTHREIFRHLALRHESPAEVAASLGLPRNTVDKMKSRMTEYLRELVERMKGVC